MQRASAQPVGVRAEEADLLRARVRSRFGGRVRGGVRAEEADLLRVRVGSRVGGRVRGGVRAEDADRVLLVGTAHGVVLVRVRVRG